MCTLHTDCTVSLVTTRSLTHCTEEIKDLNPTPISPMAFHLRLDVSSFENIL